MLAIPSALQAQFERVVKGSGFRLTPDILGLEFFYHDLLTDQVNLIQKKPRHDCIAMLHIGFAVSRIPLFGEVSFLWQRIPIAARPLRI